MTTNQIKTAHVDSLLAVFRVLDVNRMDVDTITTTFRTPKDLTREAFSEAVEEGYLTEEDGQLYGLTAKGEQRIDEMTFRCGSIKVVSPEIQTLRSSQ